MDTNTAGSSVWTLTGVATDQDGMFINDDTSPAGQWHSRTIDLSPEAGNQIQSIYVSAYGNGPGSWSVDFTDFVITSSDGTVRPIYNGTGSIGMWWWGSPTMTNIGYTVGQVATDSASTRYYVADHLGTAVMELSSGGWPVYQGQFAPFGQELQPNGSLLPTDAADGSSSHYKFTGKERDTESGLDYFEARYYASSMGRFMSPDDPKYSEKTNPQSWNLYSYVSNNPLSRTDPTGNNWFNVGGSYQWHDGSDWEDGDGNKYHSDYNVLLRIQKTGKYTKDGAEIENLTLLGHGEDDVLAKGTGYTGSTQQNFMRTPNGDYEINLNIRGGPSSERVVFVGGQPTLGAFPGIQQLGDFSQDGKTYNAGGDWGQYRANLNGPNGPTHFYLHGKDDFFGPSARTYTHGCSTEPDQKVLKTIFKLSPAGVGEGAKNGRILVNVSGK